jgi:hypothetical protein
MAGTMPHAIFVEVGLDRGATVAAYAAELPGCAVFATSDADATGAMPQRVRRFLEWLEANGEAAPRIAGDNWYEVERASAGEGSDGRATFSLDELPPSDEEWERWRRWLELAREALAEAIDVAGLDAASGNPALAAITAQDEALVRGIGGEPGPRGGDPIDRFYAVRDALLDGLETRGPSASGARRAIRLVIADDLRLADRLRGGGG